MNHSIGISLMLIFLAGGGISAQKHSLPALQNKDKLSLNEWQRLPVLTMTADEIFPSFITTGDGFSSPGCFTFAVSPYLVVLDNDGDQRYVRKTIGGCRNFAVQSNGLLTYFDVDKGKFIGMDINYNVVDSFAMVAGYSTDFHNLTLLPDGHFLVLTYHPVGVDMSKLVSGGDPNATVSEVVLQEVDRLDNPVFLWKSLEHIPVTDCDTSLVDLTASVIDYMHTNHFTVTPDGNYLISSRNLSEVTKIDRQTGNILWRLGGLHNEFGGDTVDFHAIHSAYLTDENHLLLFDNGLTSRMSSSANAYYIDQVNKTVMLEKKYTHQPDIFTPIMGNAYQLEDESILVGWGKNNDNHICTVYDPQGVPVIDISTDPLTPLWSYQVSWNSTMDTLVKMHKDTIDAGVIYTGDSTRVKVIMSNTSGEVLNFTGWEANSDEVSAISVDPRQILPGDSLTLVFHIAAAQSGAFQHKLFLYFLRPENGTLEEQIIRKVYIQGTSVVTGNEEISRATNIRIYPNPVEEWLYIRSDEILSKVVISDVSGRILKISNHFSSDVEINMREFEDGLYFIYLFLPGDQIHIRRVVKSSE